MRVRIHRGTREIGGTCIELQHDSARLLLDLGLRLDGDLDDTNRHPAIEDLSGSGDLLALVLSDGHRDHVGLSHLAGPDLPVAMGEATLRILRAAAAFVPDSYVPAKTITFAEGQTLSFGPFTVTPILVDHSAYDAYALLVEAGGQRLLYSGDLRAHGRKGALFERLVGDPPRDIDTLPLEGSSLGRLDDDCTFPREAEIEDCFVDLFVDTEGMALVAASAQNIDRVVSLSTGRASVPAARWHEPGGDRDWRRHDGGSVPEPRGDVPRGVGGAGQSPDGNWWADVLADPDLLLAVRDRSLNVYLRGASLFRITPAGVGVAAETHAKYLVRQRQALTRLGLDGGFDLNPGTAVWTRYEGPGTLAEMKRAAAALSGLEKTGVYALVQASPNVVDVEIALTTKPAAAAVVEPDGAEADAALLAPEAEVHATPSQSRHDRLDVASLEERGVAGEAWLVFHEAKLAANPGLRSKTTLAIVAQVARYRTSLTEQAERLEAGYPALRRDLVRLDALRNALRAARGLDTITPRDPLTAEVASGARRLRVDPELRLVVFDFDADQRDGALQAITDDLRGRHGLQVYAVGRPSGRTSAAFRRPSDSV